VSDDVMQLARDPTPLIGHGRPRLLLTFALRLTRSLAQTCHLLAPAPQIAAD
jgi:hypothetical protein